MIKKVLPQQDDDNPSKAKFVDKVIAAAIKIGYSEFRHLCNVDDPNNWEPGTEVRPDGVWIVAPEPGEEGLAGGKDIAAFTEHPKKDLSIPALPFPCSFTEFEEFLSRLGGGIEVYVPADDLEAFLEEQTKALESINAPIRQSAEEYLMAARDSNTNEAIIAFELRDRYKWTNLQIARELRLDTDLQPNQIDTMKQRAQRLCMKGRNKKTKIVTP